jgi:hypothetical protein
MNCLASQPANPPMMIAAIQPTLLSSIDVLLISVAKPTVRE